MKASNSPAKASIRRHLLTGTALVLLIAGGFGGWAAATDISGAVIAVGALALDSNVKKVQHPTGGVVGEIHVRDGAHVKAGDLLVRLDPTVPAANLAIVVKSLRETVARKARLEAEQAGADTIAFPTENLDPTSPEGAFVADSEQRLFDTRLEARSNQKAQLAHRVEQLEQEVGGEEAQLASKEREIVLLEKELTGIRSLWEQQLVGISKKTDLERQAARLEGERGTLITEIAQTKGRISETQLQIVKVDADFLADVGKELREADAKAGELVERKIAAEDQLKRIEIRAPQDGTVLQSAVHTVGGVIGAGDLIMLIVPKSDALVVEAKVSPRDIDQVRTGQPATLRFSAFSQRTTPELDGAVSQISADAVAEERTGATYYKVRIAIEKVELDRLGKVELVPGMPVEAFIRTGDRTVLSYLVKPMRDQIERAFRER